MKREYFLGLDMGTGSVGWAVTDTDYEILRSHGKSMWGVRLFESADTAEERRIFRTSRRRLSRRNRRIQLLQEIFAEEIAKVDMGFFLRMKESRYVPEDKRDLDGKCPTLPYTLFVDSDYTDKDYYKEFPTIYHLRNTLMTTKETPDMRLVYLALHHIMKHRGHFLLSGSLDNIKEFSTTFKQFVKVVENEELDFQLFLGEDEFSKIEEVLKDKKITKSEKKSKLIKELGAKTVCEKGIITLLTGGTAKLSDIFGNEELDNCEKPKVSFADNNYDEYVAGVEESLREQYCVIEAAKAVYDWEIMADILDDSSSISQAKVALYEKHKKDLAYLKKVCKTFLTKKGYSDIFVVSDSKLKNYPAYIGMTKINGKKVNLESKKSNKQDFYDFLRKNVIKKINNPEVISYLEEELSKGTFLPRQINSDNSVLPHQIHLYELKRILDNLEDKFPVLKENKEKIIQLFEFRIPYYVGPLGQSKDNKFAWAVRKKEPVYPWNFEDIVDIESSAEIFIRRMTNKCTYLHGEDVLPKDSLLYSKFMVLNELNNLRLDGEKIDVLLKQRLYTELFCKCRKVTKKKLEGYLVREGIVKKGVEITGIDGDFKASLTAYHDFKEKLTGATLSQSEKESIILNIALFGEDKKLLRKRLDKLFPKLTPTQKKALCTLSYKGWGRLSKKFLEEITIPAPETGEIWNIITALWETNENLNQLLSYNYTFLEEIDAFNAEQKQKKLTYTTVNEMYVSPTVKRQIWQSLQIVKEIQKIMGNAPKRVFIEMAREKQESKRTESRKKHLTELYKACKNEERDWIKELNQYEDHQLRSDKLYLYYTQKGCCMYSGEKIKIEELWDNTKYDIDHIYPQSKTMDDSLDNRVLVKREYNKEKGDIYPINESIRKKQRTFWKGLLDGKFISKKKYERLTRCEELSPDELAGFIERQIVETRQSTKAVAEVLKQALPDTEIVYAKAKPVSEFRKTYDFVKVRDMNDLHHAKDAYLNVVVGNTYFVKFTKSAAWFIKENPGRSYNLEKMFNFDVIRGDEIAWKAGSKGSICTIRRYMSKNNILVTRKSYEAKGGLFDQQIMKKGKGQVPIKGSDDRLADIQKYGGYNKASGTYFMLVESLDKKGNRIRTIEFVPLYLKDRIEKNKEFTLSYLKCERQLKEPRILISKIKIDTLFKVDGFKMWISGRTGNRILFKCANELILDDVDVKTLKKVLKYTQRVKDDKNSKISEKDEIDFEMLIRLYDKFLDKLENSIYGVRLSTQKKTLKNGREQFIELTKEDQCIVLSEILHMFQCQSCSANLKLIGGPANAGILVMNNNITDCNQISILNQSPTGMYEKEIDLLKI